MTHRRGLGPPAGWVTQWVTCGSLMAPLKWVTFGGTCLVLIVLVLCLSLRLSPSPSPMPMAAWPRTHYENNYEEVDKKI